MNDRLGDKARLSHVLLAIEEMETFLDGVDWEVFVRNVVLRLAASRELEIIGEACNHISEETKNLDTKVEWRRIIGLRNLIAHAYFGIDYKTVWSIIQVDLPILKRQIITLMNYLDETN
jgi:uncharacterized protein with HEPN domain